jgi:hypothetical protein
MSLCKVLILSRSRTGSSMHDAEPHRRKPASVKPTASHTSTNNFVIWYGADCSRPLHGYPIVWASLHYTNVSSTTLCRVTSPASFRSPSGVLPIHCPSCHLAFPTPWFLFLITNCTVQKHCAAGHRTALCVFHSSGVFFFHLSKQYPWVQCRSPTLGKHGKRRLRHLTLVSIQAPYSVFTTLRLQKTRRRSSKHCSPIVQ